MRYAKRQNHSPKRVNLRKAYDMNPDYTLYLCTDSALMRADSVEDCVERAVRGVHAICEAPKSLP